MYEIKFVNSKKKSLKDKIKILILWKKTKKKKFINFKYSFFKKICEKKKKNFLYFLNLKLILLLEKTLFISLLHITNLYAIKILLNLYKSFLKKKIEKMFVYLKKNK